MGNFAACWEKEENLDNIIEERNEIFNFSPEDNKIPDDAEFIDNHGGEYPIETEESANFRYEAKYPNLVNKEKIVIENLAPQKIYETELEEVDYSSQQKYQEQKSMSDMINIQKGQIMRIKQLFDLCYRNGKPRSCDDFNPKGYAMFYPVNDPYFFVDRTNVFPNRLKIYNKDDKDRIQIYQGDLNSEGQRHGIGKCTTPYYVLMGMWKFDQFSGWGRESRSNGDVFEGRFQNGFLNGKGIFMNDQKCKYVGDFLNTKRWGKGDLTTPNIHYEGDFYNNQMHGNGRIIFFRDGIEYMGTFKNDQLTGYGKFKWKNGDKYEGPVLNGKIHGYGKYKFSDGRVIMARFREGIKEESDKMRKYEIWKNSYYGLNYTQNMMELKQKEEQEEGSQNQPKSMLSDYRNKGFPEENQNVEN